ncbi:hypothetical protein AGMMS50218_00770 [Actinomycetota bacterium]|nr:hypothetical protein AGMMS50218_00770 [Actinomycetota bacterium]
MPADMADARGGVLTRPGRARGPLPRVPTAVPAAATLAVGFAVAQGTGVRALGGVVLLAGVAWCGWRALPAAGVARVGAVVVLGAGCFVASHVLAPHLGAWPSVGLAAVALGVGTAVLVDRGPR